jgi:hypothetical protein
VDMTNLNVVTDVFAGSTPPVWAGGANETFTWTDRFFVNDLVSKVPISNTLVSINHESGPHYRHRISCPRRD